MARLRGVAAILVCLAAQTGGAGGMAFPGAEGYGADADGWRGGQVIAVTSLDDGGPGSLRACAENSGPRVCIFDVAGTITLNGPIMVRSGVYIAGQTAPGSGIQLRLGHSRTGPVVIKDATDVVIRFLKIRPGTGGTKTPNIDSITVENAQRVYLGNLSMAFASDETFNIHVSGSTAQDITLADSILAYSLDKANHPKGKHSKGALICSDEGQETRCGRITLLRNLFAHNRDRNPDIKATDIGPVEVINNIFYDAISQFGEFYDLLGDTQIAYVGNLALSGPSTKERAATAVEGFDWSPDHALQIWASDNLAYHWVDCIDRRAMPILDDAARAMAAATPIALTVTPMPAADVEVSLPGRVGDRLPDGTHRDDLDRRTLSDLAECKGHVINEPQQVDGWPAIESAPARADRDGDHFPDEWEMAQAGMDPDRADDPWMMPAGSDVAAIEMWLAERAGDR